MSTEVIVGQELDLALLAELLERGQRDTRTVEIFYDQTWNCSKSKYRDKTTRVAAAVNTKDTNIYPTQCYEIVQISFFMKGNIHGEKSKDSYVKVCTKDWLRKAFDWPKTQHDNSALPEPLDGRLARALGAHLDWALDDRLVLAVAWRS